MAARGEGCRIHLLSALNRLPGAGEGGEMHKKLALSSRDGFTNYKPVSHHGL